MELILYVVYVTLLACPATPSLPKIFLQASLTLETLGLKILNHDSSRTIQRKVKRRSQRGKLLLFAGHMEFHEIVGFLLTYRHQRR